MSIPSWLTANTDASEKDGLGVFMCEPDPGPDLFLTVPDVASVAVVDAVSFIYTPDLIDGLEVNTLLERRELAMRAMSGGIGAVEKDWYGVSDKEITSTVINNVTDLLIAAALNNLS